VGGVLRDLNQETFEAALEELPAQELKADYETVLKAREPHKA
jgi:hypothetical protein